MYKTFYLFLPVFDTEWKLINLLSHIKDLCAQQVGNNMANSLTFSCSNDCLYLPFSVGFCPILLLSSLFSLDQCGDIIVA